MHECVMMSEHLVHYLRSLVAKFNAVKCQDKKTPEAKIVFAQDDLTLFTWDVVRDLFQTSQTVAYAKKTTKVHIYLIQSTERFPRPG